MLQIMILHGEKSVKVMSIRNIETLEVLSYFDEPKGMIDVEPLKNYIGQKVMISHYNDNGKNNVTFDYEHEKTITKVEQDKDGIWYFEYN